MKSFVLFVLLISGIPAFCQHHPLGSPQFDLTYPRLRCLPGNMQNLRIKGYTKVDSLIEYDVVLTPDGKVSKLTWLNGEEKFLAQCEALMKEFEFFPAILNGVPQWGRVRANVLVEGGHQTLNLSLSFISDKKNETDTLKIPF